MLHLNRVFDTIKTLKTTEKLIMNFGKELESLYLTMDDYQTWLQEWGDNFKDYDDEDKKRIYIMQEHILMKNSTLELKSEQLDDAVANLMLNY